MTRSLSHVGAALRKLHGVDAVLSDGEHVGIPLALAMRTLGITTPHLMIGHRPTAPIKAPFFRLLHAERRIDRILVHSSSQRSLVSHRLGLPPAMVSILPYGIDTEFWRPEDAAEETLVVAPGREHRDHRTLAAACRSQHFRVAVTGASAHSPRSRRAAPPVWPPNVELGAVSYLELRRLYARASIVVVPLLPADFPAGVTSLVEAMAMGKAVVASATVGLRGIVEDGETGLLVPPGDAGSLREALCRLLADPRERERLGGNARALAIRRHGLDLYAERLAGHLSDLGRCGGSG